MALKISQTGLLTKHYLVVTAEGLRYCETAFVGGKRRFRFEEIECVLMSPDHVLSFQVGNEVFSILTQPGKSTHQQAIQTLIERLEATAPAAQLMPP